MPDFLSSAAFQCIRAEYDRAYHDAICIGHVIDDTGVTAVLRTLIPSRVPSQSCCKGRARSLSTYIRP